MEFSKGSQCSSSFSMIALVEMITGDVEQEGIDAEKHLDSKRCSGCLPKH